MSARVLVTGSRNWTDKSTVYRALFQAWLSLGNDIVVVHGACPAGADRLASEWIAGWPVTGFRGVAEEPHPASWATHGRAAGPLRNEHMVGLGANLCLAFIRDSSRGASHCARLAEAAGIPVRRFVA
ncbi:SLOG family protein [Streptomyces klenkii]|uniref:SLOG family protein n=1 Tax=Streptomyces klenkii TaxID=1420899 RepID=UPI0036EC6D8D